MEALGVVGRALGSTSNRAALAAAVVTAALSLALTLPSHVVGLGEKPPDPVDARDYDHLALNLARGRGFAYCWSDPEWRAPYERSANSALYDLHLSLGGPCHPTARRAPGYPAALATVYGIWGRSFEAGRWLGALALALAAATGAFLAASVGGAVAAMVFAACFLLDHDLRFLVGAYMSEPIACLAVMGVLAVHAAMLRAPVKAATAILAGASLGLLMLVRHHFLILFALAVLGAAFVAVRSARLRCSWSAYAVAALLVLAPWCIRNCLVLGAAMPLGTQGGHGLAASYGGNEVKGHGTWNTDESARLWAKRKGRADGYKFPDLASEMRSSLATERELAELGQVAALEWLSRNWRQLPRVALVRLRAHARGYGALGLAAVIAGLGALAFPETRRLAGLSFAVLAMTALTVALTSEGGRGRYSAPVRPVVYFVGAIGLAATAQRLIGTSRAVRPSTANPRNLDLT